MIKHIVMWKLKSYAEGNDKKTNAEMIKSKLESLQTFIPEIKSIEIGINIFEENNNFDLVFISTFDNFNTLESYQKHPAHLEVAEFVSKVRDSRSCVDYLIL